MSMKEAHCSTQGREKQQQQGLISPSSMSSLFKGLCLKPGIAYTEHVASLLVPLQSGLQDILEDVTLEGRWNIEPA